MKNEDDKELKNKESEPIIDKPVHLVVEEVKEQVQTSEEIEKTAGEDQSKLLREKPQFFPKESSINKSFILLTFGVMCLTMIIIGGIFVSRQSIENQKSSKITPTAAPVSVSPDPTPTASADYFSLKIKILNGSGISGKAGELKKYLEGKGYKNLEAGNADTYDYKNLQLSVKNEYKNLESQLTEDIKGKYILNKEVSTLNADNLFDAVITIGK